MSAKQAALKKTLEAVSEVVTLSQKQTEIETKIAIQHDRRGSESRQSRPLYTHITPHGVQVYIVSTRADGWHHMSNGVAVDDAILNTWQKVSEK